MKTHFAAAALTLGLAAGPAPDATAAGIQRFALIAGANFGGQARPRLKYAVSDAQRFNRVMHDLGGLEAGNVVLLEQPSLKQLQEGLEALGRRVAATAPAADAARPRTEVVVYYSGHADEAGLLLGDDRYSYRTLRAALDGIGADVHIAVLDACASGAITRLKGGQARAPFMVDTSSRMRGHAFLTSSAADETAQESDRIGASYFTYYLISGLRGAADVSGEGTVTLDEAYRYAFRETLGRTVGTRGGAQHPSYDISLAGTGDVVMTDLRSTSAGLVLAEDLAGRCYLRDGDQRLVMEVQKPKERRIELGLAAGRYELRCQDGDRTFSAHPTLQDGAQTVLAAADFTPVKAEPTTARGDAPAPPLGSRTMVSFELGRSDLAEGFKAFSFTRWLNSRLAVGLRLDKGGDGSYSGYNTVSRSYTRSTRTELMAHLRLDLRHYRSGAPARPYIFGGLGPAWVDTMQEEVPLFPEPYVPINTVITHTKDSQLGAEAGLGVDAMLGRRFTLGVRAGIRTISYGGSFEYGVTFGYRLGGGGKPQP